VTQPSPSTEPTRAEIEATPGPLLLEFGTDWCGHCRRAQPLITEALARHPGMQHMRVIDGAGKPLGRSFGVEIWPTLVLLRESREVSRLVRPSVAEEIARAAEELQA